MGVWTTDPKSGKSQWRDEFPDTPEGQAAAQADTDKRSSRSSSKAQGDGNSSYDAGDQTQGNEGTNYGYQGAGPGGTETDRTKSIYGYRAGEKLPDWMQRVFQQGTRDFGGALSPDSSNPYGRTPYATWFQNQYQNVVPANMLLQQILTNSGGSSDFAPNTQAGIEAFMNGGDGRGFGTGTAGAQANLGKLNDMLNAFANKNTSGLSSDQNDMLGELMDNPSDVLAMVNAQLSGGQGANPLAARYVQNIGQRMLDEYYDDPVGHAPDTHGTYLQNLMKQLNMAR
jgi:hypothetical protein